MMGAARKCVRFYQRDSSCRKDFEKMKKLFQVYKPFMIRPTVYKAFPRLIAGLLVAGLWNRYANTMQVHRMTQSIFYLIGFIFLALAWFSYLGLDGMDNPFTKLGSVFTKNGKKRTKTANHTKQMIDFVEEDPVEYEDLDPQEQIACKLVANLFCALFFLLPALFSYLF